MNTKLLFNRIFNNKGHIWPIAEKAKRNFGLIKNNSHNKKEKIYHFCLGHSFKNIDKAIFESEYDEKEDKFVPTKFKSLQKSSFTFHEDLYTIIENIRNLNSHYVHTFDKL